MNQPVFMEPAEEMQVVETLQLADDKELLFYSHTFRKRRLGSIRLFVDAPKYSGPTKSGIDMTLVQLKDLYEALEPLPDDLDSGRLRPPVEIGRIAGDSKGSEWVIQIIEPEGKSEQHCLDVRKYVDSEKFTGWTRKGLRIDVDLIDEVLARVPALIQAMVDWEAGRTGLFSRDYDAQESSKKPKPQDAKGNLISVPEDLKGYF